ncbi:hypothetical protein BTVI_46658 [Pitangus sulphuratus]|nr:hypothetical protein BTVI_46658 [Pitangus sulphuratus]
MKGCSSQKQLYMKCSGERLGCPSVEPAITQVIPVPSWEQTAGSSQGWTERPEKMPHDPVTLPTVSSSSQTTFADIAHLSKLAGGMGIALDLVQTNTVGGTMWMWHGCGSPRKEILSQEMDWHRQLQEKLVPSLLQLPAHCSAAMKPYPMGANVDSPSLHVDRLTHARACKTSLQSDWLRVTHQNLTLSGHVGCSLLC